MLINTVLIFLQNILPIFLVFSLLLAQQFSYIQNHTRINKTTSDDKSLLVYLSVNRLSKICGIGLFMITILTYFMPPMSQFFNGAGLDVIYAILFILIYCLIAISFLSSQLPFVSGLKTKTTFLQSKLITHSSIVILLLVLSVHGSYFSFYVMSLTVQNSPTEALSTGFNLGVALDESPITNWTYFTEAFIGAYAGIVMGVIIGVGICLSISILMYFILVAIDKNIKRQVTNYFLLLFGVGQLMQAIPLLEQVDIISSNIPLWSTNNFISENSEIGYFLTILFGYEATPSAMQLIIYLSTVLAPILSVNIMIKISPKQHRKSSIIHKEYPIVSPRKDT